MTARQVSAAFAAGLMVVACAGARSGQGESIEGEDVTVKMFDNRFQYTEVAIPVGGSVTWVGAGRNAHNASDTAGSWSTETAFGSLDQYEGDEATIVFDRAGRYTFYCTYHGSADGEGMAGVLVVGGESG